MGELGSLVNGTPFLRCLSGSCDLYAFTGVQSYFYWSSTTRASLTDDAWRVRLSDGIVSPSDKPGMYYVWPVRGGQ